MTRTQKGRGEDAARTQVELGKSTFLNVINGGRLTEAEAEAEAESDGVSGEVETNTKVESAAAVLPPFEVLKMKLHEAGGAAINPSLGGFISLGTPHWWLEQGCDLERDVLPTIRCICARPRQGKIISWGYFTEAVTAAKKKREQPLPDVDLSAAGQQGLPAWRTEKKRRSEEFKAAMAVHVETWRAPA